MTAKTKNIIVWVLAGLLALAFLMSGVTKLLGVEMQIKNLESWGYPLWFRFPIGLSELFFVAGLLMPKYRKLIIYGIFIWAVVAVYTHLQAGQTSMVGTPLIFALFAAVILFLLKGSPKVK